MLMGDSFLWKQYLELPSNLLISYKKFITITWFIEISNRIISWSVTTGITAIKFSSLILALQCLGKMRKLASTMISLKESQVLEHGGMRPSIRTKTTPFPDEMTWKAWVTFSCISSSAANCHGKAYVNLAKITMYKPQKSRRWRKRPALTNSVRAYQSNFASIKSTVEISSMTLIPITIIWKS